MILELGLLFCALAGIGVWRKTQKERNEIERMALTPPTSAAELEIKEQIKFWKERYGESPGVYQEERNGYSRQHCAADDETDRTDGRKR